MLKEHSNISVECGTNRKNCFIMNNGEILHLSDKKAYVKGQIPSGEIYVDGSQVGEFRSNIIIERKILSNDGMFMFIFTINPSTKELVSKTQVVSRGFIYMKENEELTKNLIAIAEEKFKELLSNYNKSNYSELQRTVEQYMNKYINDTYDRNPLIICTVSEIIQ